MNRNESIGRTKKIALTNDKKNGDFKHKLSSLSGKRDDSNEKDFGVVEDLKNPKVVTDHDLNVRGISTQYICKKVEGTTTVQNKKKNHQNTTKNSKSKKVVIPAKKTTTLIAKPRPKSSKKCKSKTARGNDCPGDVYKDGLCAFHHPDVPKCGKLTRKGTPCQVPRGLCKYHGWRKY